MFHSKNSPKFRRQKRSNPRSRKDHRRIVYTETTSTEVDAIVQKVQEKEDWVDGVVKKKAKDSPGKLKPAKQPAYIKGKYKKGQHGALGSLRGGKDLCHGASYAGGGGSGPSYIDEKSFRRMKYARTHIGRNVQRGQYIQKQVKRMGKLQKRWKDTKTYKKRQQQRQNNEKRGERRRKKIGMSTLTARHSSGLRKNAKMLDADLLSAEASEWYAHKDDPILDMEVELSSVTTDKQKKEAYIKLLQQKIQTIENGEDIVEVDKEGFRIPRKNKRRIKNMRKKKIAGLREQLDAALDEIEQSDLVEEEIASKLEGEAAKRLQQHTNYAAANMSTPLSPGRKRRTISRQQKKPVDKGEYASITPKHVYQSAIKVAPSKKQQHVGQGWWAYMSKSRRAQIKAEKEAQMAGFNTSKQTEIKDDSAVLGWNAFHVQQEAQQVKDASKGSRRPKRPMGISYSFSSDLSSQPPSKRRATGNRVINTILRGSGDSYANKTKDPLYTVARGISEYSGVNIATSLALLRAKTKKELSRQQQTASFELMERICRTAYSKSNKSNVNSLAYTRHPVDSESYKRGEKLMRLAMKDEEKTLQQMELYHKSLAGRAAAKQVHSAKGRKAGMVKSKYAKLQAVKEDKKLSAEATHIARAANAILKATEEDDSKYFFEDSKKKSRPTVLPPGFNPSPKSKGGSRNPLVQLKSKLKRPGRKPHRLPPIDSHRPKGKSSRRIRKHYAQLPEPPKPRSNRLLRAIYTPSARDRLLRVAGNLARAEGKNRPLGSKSASMVGPRKEAEEESTTQLFERLKEMYPGNLNSEAETRRVAEQLEKTISSIQYSDAKYKERAVEQLSSLQRRKKQLSSLLDMSSLKQDEIQSKLASMEAECSIFKSLDQQWINKVRQLLGVLHRQDHLMKRVSKEMADEAIEVAHMAFQKGRKKPTRQQKRDWGAIDKQITEARSVQQGAYAELSQLKADRNEMASSLGIRYVAASSDSKLEHDLGNYLRALQMQNEEKKKELDQRNDDIMKLVSIQKRYEVLSKIMEGSQRRPAAQKQPLSRTWYRNPETDQVGEIEERTTRFVEVGTMTDDVTDNSNDWRLIDVQEKGGITQGVDETAVDDTSGKFVDDPKMRVVGKKMKINFVEEPVPLLTQEQEQANLKEVLARLDEQSQTIEMLKARIDKKFNLSSRMAVSTPTKALPRRSKNIFFQYDTPVSQARRSRFADL